MNPPFNPIFFLFSSSKGCPTTKHLDLQLILDSSNSIMENMWIDLLDYIKSDFLDSIFTVKDSQLAVTRFGTGIEILQ